jgi:peptidoglycan hydrolase-like protein with peptidoglycan-binding domain
VQRNRRAPKDLIVPSRPRQNSVLLQRALPLLVLPALVALATACNGNGGSTAAAEAPSTVTVPVSPAPVVTDAATTTMAPTTTMATTTTVAPTTVPPTTVPPTTEAPITTTTEPAPTTTLAPNVEIIGPSAVPIEAVGTRDGAATAVLQERLNQLGFWSAAADGKYGLTTKQAVMAFQKYFAIDATGSVDENTAALMTQFTEKAHGAADTGSLIEVDKVKQLLFIIRDGKTVLVLNASTGNGQPYEEEDKNTPGEIQKGVSLTPDGMFKVNRERAEGWWEGDLGEIYRPKYFVGGVAVHGSNSIPNYPASHGCVRVSVPAMDMIWAMELMPMKSVVWVHGG